MFRRHAADVHPHCQSGLAPKGFEGIPYAPSKCGAQGLFPQGAHHASARHQVGGRGQAETPVMPNRWISPQLARHHTTVRSSFQCGPRPSCLVTTPPRRLLHAAHIPAPQPSPMMGETPPRAKSGDKGALDCFHNANKVLRRSMENDPLTFQETLAGTAGRGPLVRGNPASPPEGRLAGTA